MRVKIDGFDIEGTPDEIAALIRAQKTTQDSVPVALQIKDATDVEDERFASEKIAFRALRRRPLSAAQRVLFRTLLDAYPNWVPSTTLQKATKYNANQLGGVLGATGRRLSQTDGHALGSSLIEWMWDADENEYTYRLPPSVFAAVRRINP